jgi:putative restriction endonuclease
MYLAVIEAGSYLDFSNPVPFTGPDGLVEKGLLNEDGQISGRAQSAVRPISPADFDRILALGLPDEVTALPRTGFPSVSPGFQDKQMPFDYQRDRERFAYLSSRPFRDRVFRQVVLRAYNARCAVTGLKLINGGGRAEAEAAHIQPVEHNGPDVVTNGLALSGTAHWMFDRGLISVSDDSEILVSRHLNDADSVRSLINKSGRVLLPDRFVDRPHPHFLRWHRENCFKN